MSGPGGDGTASGGTGEGDGTQTGADDEVGEASVDESGGSADNSNCMDEDADNYGEQCAAGPDCNDGDPDINPGAPETCDGVDENCDEMIDNGCECPDDGISGDCNMPTDMGMLNVGESKPGVVANIPQENALDWYTVAFPAAARPGEGTPTIEFAINENDAFVFDVVVGQCEAGGVTCTSGGTGGAGIGLTSWSFVDDQKGCCTPPNDSMVPWPNQVYLRVYRTTPGASCDAYQLQFNR